MIVTKVKIRSRMMDNMPATGYREIHPHLLRWRLISDWTWSVGPGFTLNVVGAGRGAVEDVAVLERERPGPGSVGCVGAGNGTVVVGAARETCCGACIVIVPSVRGSQNGPAKRAGAGGREKGRRVNESVARRFRAMDSSCRIYGPNSLRAWISTGSNERPPSPVILMVTGNQANDRVLIYIYLSPLKQCSRWL